MAAGHPVPHSNGQKCDDKRQEFILLSDTLGLSMLTVAMNNDKPQGCTEATVFGPFHVEGAPHYAHGDDVANGAKGEPCLVRGSVKGLDGQAVANAVIDVWQADADGKKTGRDPRVLPRTVIYDPELSTNLPLALSVTSAPNAIAHAAEGL